MSLALASYFGPQLWQGHRFRIACRDMLVQVKTGNLQGVTPYILPSQRPRADQIFQRLQANYNEYIHSLSLYRVKRLDNDTMEALVSCRVGTEEAAAPYQGRLFWHLQEGQWLWDFDSTLYAAWPASGEPRWEELEKAVAAATEAYN